VLRRAGAGLLPAREPEAAADERAAGAAGAPDRRGARRPGHCLGRALNRYFDPSSRRTQAAAGSLQQMQAQLRSVDLPRVDETLAALATAGAGR
jgi:hypothetical protein